MIRIATTEDFAAALNQLRRRAGLTQGDVGGRIGSHAFRVGEYERHQRSMGFRTALRLLDALGCQLVIVPKIGNAHSVPQGTPQAAENGSGVVPLGDDDLSAAETISGGAA